MEKQRIGETYMKKLIGLISLVAVITSCEGVTFVSGGKDKSKGSGFTISGVAKDNVTGEPIVGAEVLLMSAGGGSQGAAIGGTSQIVRRASGRAAKGRTGVAGEYVFSDVSIPEEGDVELVVRTPGFAPVYQTISRGGLSKGVRLAVNSKLLPVTSTLSIGSSGTALSSNGSVRLKLPPSSLSGIRAAVARAGKDDKGKETKKVVAQVAVADPKVDQDVSPGKMEAKEKKSDDEEEKTVALEPVALVHVNLTDEKGKAVEDVVTPEAPAKMVIEVPESIQEKHLEEFDRGKRHLDQFEFDESKGEWKKVGEARLVESDPKEDKSTEEKGKKDGNVTLCHSQEGSEDSYTLVLPPNAAESHFKHGDKRGACEKRELFAEVAVTGSGWIVVAETHEEACVEGRVVDEDGDPADEMWIRAEGLATGFLKEEKVEKGSGKYKLHVPKGQQVKLTAGLAAHGEKHKAKKEKKAKKKKNKKGKGREEVLIDTEATAKKTESGCAPAEDVETEEPVEVEAELVNADGTPAEGEVVTSEGTSAEIDSNGGVKVLAESGTVDLAVKSLEGETEVTTIIPVGGGDGETHHDLGEVVLPPVIVLTGKVESKAEDQPIEETLVIVEGNVVEPALDGTYEILAPKSEDTVTVEVVARTPDGSEFSQTQEVAVGDSEVASVPKVTVSTETISLVGRVVDEEGNGIKGVQVEAGDAAIVVTDAEGRFEVEVPKEASIVVEAHERDGDLDEDLTATQSVTPPSGGEPAVVELVINDPATLVQGEVKDAQGDPVEGAEVVSSLGAFDTTDENGQYEIRAPENDLVSVIAEVGGIREVVEVQTEESGTTEVVDVAVPVEDVPPTVQSAEVEPLVVSPGGTVTIEVVVADDGGSVDFTVPEVEAGEVTTPDGSSAIKDGEGTVTVTWKAPEAEDLYEVPVTIQDAAGQSMTVEVSVEVRKENAPPTIMQVVPSTQAPVADEKVLVTVVANDPEGDKLQFDWTLKTEDGTDLSKLLEVDGGPLATFTCPKGLKDKELELEVKVTDCLASSPTSSGGCKPVAERSEKQDVSLEVGEGEARPSVEEILKQSVDAAVPETRLDSQPASLTKSPDAEFKCASPDVNATFECALDGTAFRKCPASQNYAELSSGAHTFLCRAKDGSGSVDPSPVSYVWTVDRVAPTFGGCSSAAASGAGQVELKWTSASDNVSPATDIVYQVCKATTSGGCCGSSFTPTFTTAAGASSYTVTGLTGSSQFYFIVRAQDKAGNVDTNQIEKAVAFVGSAPSRVGWLSPPAASCGGN